MIAVNSILLLAILIGSSLVSHSPTRALAQDGRVMTAPAPPPGMENYVMVFLRRGPAFAAVSTPEGHWVHLKGLVEAGKRVAGGPLTDDGDIRGVSVFKVGSAEEAMKLAQADPAVEIGRMTAEAHPWWGPAAIGTNYAADARKYSSLIDMPMTTYYFGLVKAGPTRAAAGTPEAARLQAAHLSYVRRLSEARKICAAGPFLDGGALRGAVVFTVGSLAEAQALTADDPAVRAGHLTVEIHPWMVATGVMRTDWIAPSPDQVRQ